MNREPYITIENNTMDTDCEIGITDPAVSTAYKAFIFISLLFHVVMLSFFSVMPQFFDRETPQKPSIEAVIVNLNDPFSPSQKKPSLPSGGSSGSKIKQEIKPHEKIKSAPLPKPDPEKPKKTAKKRSVPSKPKLCEKKTETPPDVHANRNPLSVAETSAMTLSAAPSQGTIKESASDPARSEQETRANHASVPGGTGSPDQNSGKQNGPGTGKGSLPGELGMGEVDQIPKIIQTTPPVYPHSARRRNVEGKITVKFLVSATGEVMKPSVVRAEPKGIFEESVLNAVRLWKFKPGTYHGKAVATWMVLPVVFHMN